MRNFHKLQLLCSGPIIKDILFHCLVLIGRNSSETLVCGTPSLVLSSMPFLLFLRSFPHEFSFRSFPIPLKTKNKTKKPTLIQCSDSCQKSTAVQENKASSCKLGKLQVEAWISVTATGHGREKTPSTEPAPFHWRARPTHYPQPGQQSARKRQQEIYLNSSPFTQASAALLPLIQFLNNSQLSSSKTSPLAQDFCLPHFNLHHLNYSPQDSEVFYESSWCYTTAKNKNEDLCLKHIHETPLHYLTYSEKTPFSGDFRRIM